MEVKVLKKFRDRHSGEIHRAGDILTINKKRFEEILAVGLLVEEVKAEDVKAEEAEIEE